MTIKVIGTGFGRTGTDSMREALTILGFGPCHHMVEVLPYRERKQLWRDRAAGLNPSWEQLFDGFSSCVDWPSAAYWPELIEHYPDARVILTWRSAESWWASFEKTILPHLLADTETEATAPGSQMIAERVFGGRPADRDHAIKIYEANVAAVKATVPASRLLIHSLGDGWIPLCAHLGVPVPDIPYPQRNSAKGFDERIAELEASAKP
ncbi:MAG: sulfotransferase family protein [Albidovulum sp.]